MDLPPTDWFSDTMAKRIEKRYRSDRIFKGLGLASILLALVAVVAIFGNIVVAGVQGFMQTQIQLTVHLDPAKFGNPTMEQLADPELDRDQFLRSDYRGMVRETLMAKFPDVSSRRDVRALNKLVSSGARNQLRDLVMADPTIIGSTVKMWVPAATDVDTYAKMGVDEAVPEENRRLSNQQVAWIESFRETDELRTVLSRDFLTSGDSREPELAGIWGAVVGSALTLFVTLLVSLPLGVAAAVYLEEFAKKGRWSDWIEVNINNLAAVPSIVYGLLGLAIFLNFFQMPRSAPIVGGLTLALMTLPTIIIAGRAALKAVPPSIRDAAMGLGASPVQVATHHTLPLAMPGILTGSIIGMAQALGETAPLLMIGMVAFVVDIPGALNDSATVLPVQIFLWADRPERAFLEKTSAAILVLMAFLLLMNGIAIYLRKKFERKW